MASLPSERVALLPEIYLSLGLNTSVKGTSGYPRVLSVLSSLFQKVVDMNEKLLGAKEKESITIFHGLRVPDLSIRRYIDRIFKYAKCSPSCFVLSHVYIDRYLQKPNVHLTSLNVHRLLITSVVIAAKFIDDGFFNNAYYARVGGISTVELNKMETTFLFNLDFRLHVTTETFGKYCQQLEKEAVAGGCHQVERPIPTCKLKGWKNTSEEPKSQLPMQRYICKAV